MSDAPAQPPPAAPSDGTDDLGMAVLMGLSRPVGRKQTPRLMLMCFLGLASFGVLPVFRLAKRFGQYVTLEQQQLWHLAEWLRLQSGSAEAVELREEANRLRPRWVLTVGSVLCAIAAAVALYWQLRMTQVSWRSLLFSTYWFTYHHRSWGMSAYAVWGGGLAVAYGLHWLQVGLHAADRQRFMRNFDRASADAGLSPMTPTPLGAGVRPVWLVAGVAITACGAPWGVPMVLAGAIQRTDVAGAGLRDRQAMARRLHAMLQRRQGGGVAVPVGLRRMCSEEFCRTTLADGANYCPRCGARASASGSAQRAA